MSEADPLLGVPVFIGGTAIVGYVAWCWSGRHRGWLWPQRWAWAVMTFLGPFGLALIALGIAYLDGVGTLSRTLLFIAVPSVLVGVVISTVQPKGWGPSWLREIRDRGGDPHQPAQGPDEPKHRPAVADPAERLVLRHYTGTSPINEWPMRCLANLTPRAGIEGRMKLFPDGLLFVSDERVADDVTHNQPVRMTVPMPKGQITDLRLLREVWSPEEQATVPVDPPMLVVYTGKKGHTFDSRFLAADARELADRLGRPLEGA